MDNPVLEARRLGQSIWYDNIRRGLITSGELGRLIETGVTGLTSNPTIFERAIAGSTDYDEALLGMANSGKSTAETFEALAIDDIRAAADLLLPIYEATGGVDGYASLEVSPTLAHDTEGTVAEAERLYSVLDRPNVMIKVPATPEGIPAVRRLIARGINVNVTLIFALDAYREVVEAYIRGLEELTQNGGEAGGVASVASFFISRIDTAVDALIEERGRLGRDNLGHLLGKAAIANAKLAYKAFRDTFHGERFASLAGQGGRAQRPLWASTGTKNPAYSDVLYMDSLIGPDTVNTVPPATLTAFLEHGTASPTLERDLLDAQETMQALERAGIDVNKVTSRLLADGVKSFAESFEKLLANIEEKRARLVGGAHVHPGAGLGSYLPDVEEAVADLQNRDVVGRIWRKDHTVWQPSSEEITNRLGWLNVTDQMGEQAPSLVSFAQEVRDAGFRHVVLLGMGGSSMGPEALRQTFGSAEGYPELIVLDSTVPSWVEGVAGTIDPSRTLFLVSSKSGTTVETLSLYRYFRGILERQEGTTEVGSNFVAITDAGTPLERLAREQGFRRVFCNPSDLGGRYSVLSYFGLVPGALMGIDIDKLLDRAECMREGCSFCVAAHDNPGAWLGASMGTLAMRGRDKLTLVTSPSISGFGLWVEQLVAESTGKKGRGIVPLVGEPLVPPSHYGR
ncbi:MAG: bifunctional transaldolase/phosoglucose isomerase, partial [Chloroflexi bacterium]|nr:bifunctional transaldolase/phosoglucose isomerase [Chloroflexota bacterium]